MSLVSYPIVGKFIPKANGISRANEAASKTKPIVNARKCSRSVLRNTVYDSIAIERAKAVERTEATEV